MVVLNRNYLILNINLQNQIVFVAKEKACTGRGPSKCSVHLQLKPTKINWSFQQLATHCYLEFNYVSLNFTFLVQYRNYIGFKISWCIGLSVHFIFIEIKGNRAPLLKNIVSGKCL